VKNASNSQTVGEYTYDAMGRRVRKVITNGGITGTLTNGTTDYLYDQNQCVEERDGSNSHTKQYIWGVYIDELIQQKTYATTGGGGLAAGEYYPLQDQLYRTTALTDDVGDIVEAYDYDAYGSTLIFKSAGTGGDWWADDAVTTDSPSCGILFCGYRFDPDAQLYHVRRRTYHPVLGRWLQRDPLIYVDGIGLYEYVKSNPTNRQDFTGTFSCQFWCTAAFLACAGAAGESGIGFIACAISYHLCLKNCPPSAPPTCPPPPPPPPQCPPGYYYVPPFDGNPGGCWPIGKAPVPIPHIPGLPGE
jgi:RHS repeat-associated protein